MRIEDTIAKFKDWLSNNYAGKFSISDCVQCITNVSNYSMSHSISKIDFWMISNYKTFNQIRVSLSSNKIFKLKHPIDYRSFDKIGKIYSDFIRFTFGETVKKQPSTEKKEPVIFTNTKILEIDDKPNCEEKIINNDNFDSLKLSYVEEEQILKKFSTWILNEKKLSISSSNSYASNLRLCDKFALEKKIISKSIFSASEKELFDMARDIINNDDFYQYNIEKHHRFSAALKAYIEYKLYCLKIKNNQNQGCESSNISNSYYCSEAIKKILLERFQYGIRVDSAIDLLKLKNYVSDIRLELPDDELLKKQILNSGLQFEGKVYFFSDKIINEIVNLIKNLFNKGIKVVYYDSFFEEHLSWFDDNKIYSSELIREILDRYINDAFVSKNFIYDGSERINEEQAVDIELKRVWGNETIYNYDYFYENLPFIPNEKIKYYLSKCFEFVWTSSETFTRLSKFIINENDKNNIINYVGTMCDREGYVSFADIPLGSIVEDNYLLSTVAIQDCIYRLLLKDYYSLNGKIITKFGGKTDALLLTKIFCSDKQKCTFEELTNYVIGLTGTSNRQIAFRAAYDTMIRINEKEFVADCFVNFDIESIDALLEKSVVGDFIAIKNIATFALFPNCGYTWNYYLLESFCYRFSNIFRLEYINFNDKNAGIIVKKESELTYNQMLSIVAANSGIELSVENVGEFLFNNGYTTKSKMYYLEEITEKAKLLREEK